MNKKTILIYMVLLFIVVFSGCSSQNAKTVKLSSSFDEAKIKSASESAISLINSGEYQKLSDTMVRPDLRSKLSADIIKDAVQKTMSKAGEFVSFEKEAINGTEDNAKNIYAVNVVTAKYKNQTVTFTISFDTSMNIVGLYMR